MGAQVDGNLSNTDGWSLRSSLASITQQAEERSGRDHGRSCPGLYEAGLDVETHVTSVPISLARTQLFGHI